MDWYWRGPDFWIQFRGLLRLVDVADVCAVYSLDRDPDYHRPRQRKILDDHEHSETTIPQSGNGQLKVQQFGAERGDSNDSQELPA